MLLRSLLVVTLLWSAGPPVWAQEAQPSDFSTMAAEQLIAEVARLKETGDFSGDLAEAAGARAIELLNGLDGDATAESLTVARLAKLAEPALAGLTPEQRQQLAETIGSGLFDPQDPAIESLHPSYDWLHFRVNTINTSGGDRTTAQALVEEWIEEVGLENLSVEMTRWCLEQTLPQNVDRKEFSVTWTGNVTAPRSGEYVFSVLPINVNKQVSPTETVEHAMTVSVNGQAVVTATPEDWAWQGTPIRLEADQSTPLRVELRYKTTDSTYGDSPHALLFWEGPGLARQVVPPGALTPPEGDGNGLHATYILPSTGPDDRGPQQVVRTEPNIEFAWATCRNVAPSNPQLVRDLTERLWTLVTEPTYIAQQVADPVHGHPYFRNYTSTEYLSLSRRREFLELLLNTPALVERADEKAILRLYHSLRFGDEDLALDLLGTWMQQRPDAVPEIAEDFFSANRRFYRTVAVYFLFRSVNTDQFRVFRDQFLEKPDRGCCLPVAYSLAYGYLMQGMLENWIEFVDERIAVESISDDARVGWLLARAHAEEIRFSPATRASYDYGNPLSALQFLDAAELIAVSEKVRLRLTMERVARLSAEAKFDEAEDELRRSAGRFSDNNLNQQITTTQVTISDLRQQQSDDILNQQKAAQEAYLAELRRRRDRAANHGDTRSQTRLNQLILGVEATVRE